LKRAVGSFNLYLQVLLLFLQRRVLRHLRAKKQLARVF